MPYRESGRVCDKGLYWDPRRSLEKPVVPKRKVDTIETDGLGSRDINWEV